MSKRRMIVTPIAWLAKDAEEQTVQIGWVESEGMAWETASRLIEDNSEIKRVIFFDSLFVFLNGLSRPGYLMHEDDVISDEDRAALEQVTAVSEEITLAKAEQQIRAMAERLYGESCIHDDDAEELRKIADFLASIPSQEQAEHD